MLDGFPPAFFQDQWDIMGVDIFNAVKDFLKKGKLIKQINATFIALIPKHYNVVSTKELKPISLCNMVYKVLSKVLINRLKLLLDKLIFGNQKGFVKGRHILDAIIVVYELLHSMENNKKLAMAFKIDISKAYDRVSWDFLFEVLRRFGFKGRFLRMIEQCVCTPKFSVLLNGRPKGYFSSKKGLFQGDPLSPYLFIIVASTLDPITQQQFLNDTITFGEAYVSKAKH